MTTQVDAPAPPANMRPKSVADIAAVERAVLALADTPDAFGRTLREILRLDAYIRDAR